MLASKQLRAAPCSQHSSRVSRRSAVVCLAAGPRSPSEPSTSAPALSAIAAAAAATVIQLSVASSSFAAPLYDNLPGFGADSQSVFFQAVEQELQNRQSNIDDLFDENLTTVELRTFVDNVMNNKLKPEQYQAERLKMNFRRDLDGRVSLRNRQGQWFNVRPDLQVPGFLLLRDVSGNVFFLPPDAEDGDGLAQLDLSDDVVVAELFYSSAWQDVMSPLSYRDSDGAVKQLKLTEQEFRNVVSLVEGAEEPEVEEPAAAR
ncbi:hypothetical protein HYH02_009073 [Chlamydomonas schloesseri]|uniref:Uncharacterized protein n=1 Tax=Chlamydomonas schloesseri TaxID=2026947 RepID=A0A835WB85_9CHLO|nr:hypothetical protein HYH02_009073 [Chlamydomonas schloesseri]|eukprot:KAG2444133.1 hypothetical protein HYH02_009073 [Chlamydomonas schloesseri]